MAVLGNPDSKVELDENLTAKLIEILRSVSYAALPELVQRRAKHSLVDTLGVAALGSNTEPVQILKRVIQPGGKGHSTVFGPTAVHATAVDAAVINGLASHILDFDDAGSGGHVSGVIVPAVLAVAEEIDATGEATLAAMVAGYEAAFRLNNLVTKYHYNLGFHTSGTMGTFGSLAASCHLMNLDADQWANAFGIAGSLSAGLLANFGSMTKGLHTGNAARAGVYAASLAREGFTASTRILEHEAGFIRTHTNISDSSGILVPLGTRWGLDDMVYKHNASCSGTHSGADGVRQLMRENGVAAEEIDHIEIRVPKVQLEVANIQWPTTVEQGKFSIRFLVAAGVLGINTGEAFPLEDSQVADPKVHEVMGRVEVLGLANVTNGGSAEIEMHLKNGKILEIALNSIEQLDDLDTEWSQVAAKFGRTAGAAYGETAAAAATPRLQEFQDERSVRAFLADFTASKA